MARQRPDLLAGQAHLIRADKTEPFVEGTSSFRSEQDKAVEPLGPRPVNDPLEKEHGYALTAPFRFGEHIYDDGVPAFRDLASLVRARERVGQNLSELNPGSPRDDVWTMRWDRQPSDILASSQKIAEAPTRFRAQDFECSWRDLAHLVEHPRTMFSDGVHILMSSKTNRESF